MRHLGPDRTLIIVARTMGRKGNLWDKCEPEGEDHRVDYSKYMSESYHKDIQSVIPYLFADPTKKRTDPWWQISKLIDGYNANGRETACSLNLHVLDKSMSAFRPQTRATGNLPHISHILCKSQGTCLIYPIFFASLNPLVQNSKC